MKQRIVAKGVDSKRTHTVHVWSAKEEIVPTPREANPLIDELGLRDKFVVMYSGNAGIVHEFGPICEAMRLLEDDPRIYFLFVGNGPRRREIEQFATDNDIRNFQYRDYFGREQLKYSLSVADVHLISLRAPFVGISVPGKLYGIMASARPAVFVGPRECESAETITDAGCGAVIDPAEDDGAEQLAALLRDWSARGADLQDIGARGRAAFERIFERSVNCDQFEAIVARYWRAQPEVIKVPATGHSDPAWQDA
jgi:glycosyltransferase involved in cell wall biosynthesis